MVLRIGQGCGGFARLEVCNRSEQSGILWEFQQFRQYVLTGNQWQVV